MIIFVRGPSLWRAEISGVQILSLCVEARVGVGSGGGAICSGAQSLFDVLRSILGKVPGQFFAHKITGLRF